MKKHLLYFLFILFFFHFADAQTWLWATGSKVGKINTGAYWNSVTQDNAHNCYLGGEFMDTLIFGTDGLIDTIASPNIFLIKLDANGNTLWSEQGIGHKGASDGIGTCIAADRSSNIYMTGSFLGTFSFGSNTLYTNGSDFFLTKFDSTGKALWAEQSLGSNGGNSSGNSVAVDLYGNIYATGVFTATANFGSIVLNVPFYSDGAFLAKYNASGNLLWVKQSIMTNRVSMGKVAYGNAVTTDKNGNAYLTGSFADTVIFGSDTLITLNDEFYIAKFDSSGKTLWARQTNPVGHGGGGSGSGITTDRYGNVYVTGEFYDTVTFEKDTLFGPSSMNRNIFLVKYSSTGSLIWAKRASYNYTIPAFWYGYQLVSDSLNHIFLSGGNNSNGIDTISFGSVTLKSPGNKSGIIVEFDTSGKALCGSIIAGASTPINSISVDPYANNIYFGGDLISTAVFGHDTITGPIGKAEEPFIAKWQPCEHGEQGINELQPLSTACILFPNPASNRIQYIINSKDAMPAKMSVYDVLGKVITTGDLKLTEGENTFSLNTSGFSNGVYLLQINTADGTNVASKKFVVER